MHRCHDHEYFKSQDPPLTRSNIVGEDTPGSCRNELISAVYPEGYSCGCPSDQTDGEGTQWGKGDGINPIFGGTGCIPMNYDRLQFYCSSSANEINLQNVVADEAEGILATGYYLQSQKCVTDASVVT